MTTSLPVDSFRSLPPHLASAATRALLQRYVARRVPSADVEDVVQATLCDAIASGRAPAPPEDFRKWVLAIARFKVVDAHRAAARTRGDACDDVPSPPPPVEERSLARWAERQLPRGTEATLRWMFREADGEKLESIAAEEALPPERVRQRVSRLRRWLRGRWIAEMTLIALIAVAAAGALRTRREAIVIGPEVGLASEPSDARFVGAWKVVSFAPAAPMPAARQALVDRLLPGLVATFDGRVLRASAADGSLERAYAATLRDGNLDAIEVTRGDRFSGTSAWEGDELVVTIARGPWAGVARLRPAR